MSLSEFLRLVNIRKVYLSVGREVPVLHDINLVVYAGEFLTIMGASGSGKTSLLNILGCLDRPTSGVYAFQGQPVQDLDDDALSGLRKRRIGFVFQSFNLLPRLPALANVELPLVYQELGRSERRRRAAEMLAQVGLAGKEHRLPGELSGGEQQRVAVARALAARPQFLLADEPTGNLDSRTGQEIMSIFKDLHQTGLTIVMATHSQEMTAYADRRIVIRDGYIVDG